MSTIMWAHKSWPLLLFFIFVDYCLRSTDAAGNLLNSFGSVVGIANENKNNPFSRNPLLNLNNNNNYRPNTGFNNFGGLSNNKNNQFQFISPSRDTENEKNIANKIQTGLELTEDEKKTAEKFPGLQKLLDRLKEMNRQKELQKQKENGNGGDSDNNTGNKVDGADVVPGKEENKWIKLKKRKFFFQAQPVRPENEMVAENEVVYYLN